MANFIEGASEKSILTVVNTKTQAQKLYTSLSERRPDWHIVHLSANMCPAHRRKVISELKGHLQDKAKKCVCISTRLIEAGVDLDFDGAIRFLAGFDSVIQTAGRCNRNGNLKDDKGNLINGKTWILNIAKDEEKIVTLPELLRGQEIMERILREFHEEEEKYNQKLLHPELITRYFQYYYGQMPDSLLKHKIRGRDSTILDLLSDNVKSEEEYRQVAIGKYGIEAKPLTQLRQSFESAWKEFEVIEKNTIGIIVPFERGREIIANIYAFPDFQRCMELLQEAQQYSVNVYRTEISRMLDKEIVKKVSLTGDLEIYTVEEKHYHNDVGLSYEEGKISFLLG